MCQQLRIVLWAIHLPFQSPCLYKLVEPQLWLVDRIAGGIKEGAAGVLTTHLHGSGTKILSSGPQITNVVIVINNIKSDRLMK